MNPEQFILPFKFGRHRFRRKNVFAEQQKQWLEIQTEAFKSQWNASQKSPAIVRGVQLLLPLKFKGESRWIFCLVLSVVFGACSVILLSNLPEHPDSSSYLWAVAGSISFTLIGYGLAYFLAPSKPKDILAQIAVGVVAVIIGLVIVAVLVVVVLAIAFLIFAVFITVYAVAKGAAEDKIRREERIRLDERRRYYR